MVERTIVNGTSVERFAKEKTVVERLGTENMVNKKMKVDSFLVKLLGAEGLWQASYTDSSLFFYFSDNDTGFNALKRNRAKVYHSKEPKHIKVN